MLVALVAAAVTGAVSLRCYPDDDSRHAIGVVITGSNQAAVDRGKDLLSQASAVMIEEFNVQLELVGEDSTVQTPACITSSNQANTELLLQAFESYGGVHVHMVSGCTEPRNWGGFVFSHDRVCAGHTALYADRSDYITLLHEIGHLLSATHPGNVATPVCSVGGIMDYCSPPGTYDGKVGFHPDQKALICGHLSDNPPCLYVPDEIQAHTTTVVHADTILLVVLVISVGMAALVTTWVFVRADPATPWY